MSIDDFIISVFCLVDDELEKILRGKKLRQRGPGPGLKDSEVIAIEIVGEFLGMDCDKTIWEYFKRHWSHFFPKIPDRSNFARAHFSHIFKGDAAYGYCATKKERYYGFRGHIVISSTGVITGATFTKANIDERDACPELVETIKGLLLGDKGYIRP